MKTETAQIPLQRIDDYRWEIPKSYSPGMRVPGLVFADEKLLSKIRGDQSLQQVANVAHLPGIVRYSLAMPDIHWGYGFPIGGVAATDPDEGGVISPGGVGYDVNCLSGETKVLHRYGYYRTIKEIVGGRLKDPIRCYSLQTKEPEAAEVKLVLWKEPTTQVVELVTDHGRRIIAAEDHPFLTPSGMKTLEELERGDWVAIDPFEGVPYEDPGEEILIDEQGVCEFLKSRGKIRGNTIPQIISFLKGRGLIPLRRNSSVLPILIKILGFVFGDGTLYFQRERNKGITGFFGKYEDLEEIRTDLLPWFKISKIYRRRRSHRIQTDYGERVFESETYALPVNSTALATLLTLLGCPVGNKSTQDYGVPAWLQKSPLWHKRLFLASYFGAELQTPRPYLVRNRNFPCPLLTLQKNERYAKSGQHFLEQIADLLKEFGSTPLKISSHREKVVRKSGISCRFRLVISSRPRSLLALYTKIGFEYNRRKRALAAVAAAYQLAKLRNWKTRKILVSQAVRLSQEGLSAAQISGTLSQSPMGKRANLNQRFVERSLYEERNREVRTPKEFPAFEKYYKQATLGLEESGLVWETIEEFEPRFDVDKVYDITVAHPDHNFVANGFVVHNCGVRLVRSNLTQSDISPQRLRDLIYILFNKIPCGVGESGEIRVTKEEGRKLLLKGARWSVEKGYGVPADLEHTEANGVIEGADPDAVSDRAYERGRDQLGTLGSGNHFLEIQVVDKIFDEKTAGVFGLFENQITLMIHSGSRGFGYQICDDFLETARRALQKYHIQVPDIQLACAPVNSPEGQQYLGAMRAAANYAWNNRQCLLFLARRIFEKFFGGSERDLGIDLVYDVAHNIAKFERYKVNGKEKTLCVHRKGATRAFPPGHAELPQDYQATGQPVIIPGDMGRNSYCLAGTNRAMEETFGSSCHGAGRAMSRAAAVRDAQGRSIEKELAQKGIVVIGKGRKGVAEEQPAAYKDVNEVVEVMHQAGIAKKVARMRPIGVIKG